MSSIVLKKKLDSLEAEVKLLKTAVMQQPDFDIDQKSWKKIKPVLKKARIKTYKEAYG